MGGGGSDVLGDGKEEGIRGLGGVFLASITASSPFFWDTEKVGIVLLTPVTNPSFFPRVLNLGI